MSQSLNEVNLIGHLGAEPEVFQFENGGMKVNLTVATNKRWTDKNSSEKREKTEWHRVVVFGKQAEFCANYLRKGAQVFIKGELQTRKWQGQDGKDNYSTEVVVQGYEGKVSEMGRSNTQPQQGHQNGNNGQYRQPQQGRQNGNNGQYRQPQQGHQNGNYGQYRQPQQGHQNGNNGQYRQPQQGHQR